MKHRIIWILLSGFLIICVVSAIYTLTKKTPSSVPITGVTQSPLPNAEIKNAMLPVIGSKEKLNELVNKAYESESLNQSYSGKSIGIVSGNAMKSAVSESTASMPMQDSGASNTNDFSKTNVQVAGVDEADIVKTDGHYIYHINQGRIVITLANPSSQMAVVSEIKFTDQAFTPQEIYIESDFLVVIGTHYQDILKPQAQNDQKRLLPIRYGNNFAKAIIYDIKDKNNVHKLRETELEGNYISSRKIGMVLYLITSKNIWQWGIMPYLDVYLKSNNASNGASSNEKDIEKVVDLAVKPIYRDTAQSDEYNSIPYEDIRYFPESPDVNYLNIAALSIDKASEKVKIESYLGAGENIYCSLENLYISVNRYRLNKEEEKNTTSQKVMPSIQRQTGNLNTIFYKFSLNGTSVNYKAKGEVPGSILNQFSMDENNGSFRVATTEFRYSNTKNSTTNNLYILDDLLKETGKINDIAPGEKIYSVRFLGNRAYIVTFKQVDPLFVIDLKDPKNPEILGSLKIPGYSNYLHPYDENHIIGFGKDTTEIKGRAFYNGIKMALFDVSDVKNPKQKFQEIIGDRGTDSELLTNHKALLFSKEKNLLAFPVTVCEVNEDLKENVDNIPAYGNFTYQGAFVYSIDPAFGFKLKGKITHLSEMDALKSGMNSFDQQKKIDRIIYIDKTLYTISNGMYKASDINTLAELSTVKIP